MVVIQTEEGISEVELLKLEAMVGRASKGPFFKDGFDVQDDGDNEVACCNRSDELDEDTQEANAHYIAAACNAVPALVAEVRRLREKVEAWEWYEECRKCLEWLDETCCSSSTFREAEATYLSAREAVHADRE